jgi:hypothetical protein
VHYSPSGHIIQTRLSNTAVGDGFGEVGTPERQAIGHCHIKTGLGCCHTRVLRIPISYDETVKAEFGLQESIEGLAVLASVRVVDAVV